MDYQDIGPIRIFPVDATGLRTNLPEAPRWLGVSEPVCWHIVTTRKHKGLKFYVVVPFPDERELALNTDPNHRTNLHWTMFENALNTLAWIVEHPEDIDKL